jgi:hypothetical protein
LRERSRRSSISVRRKPERSEEKGTIPGRKGPTDVGRVDGDRRKREYATGARFGSCGSNDLDAKGHRWKSSTGRCLSRARGGVDGDSRDGNPGFERLDSCGEEIGDPLPILLAVKISGGSTSRGEAEPPTLPVLGAIVRGRHSDGQALGRTRERYLRSKFR